MEVISALPSPPCSRRRRPPCCPPASVCLIILLPSPPRADPRAARGPVYNHTKLRPASARGSYAVQQPLPRPVLDKPHRAPKQGAAAVKTRSQAATKFFNFFPKKVCQGGAGSGSEGRPRSRRSEISFLAQKRRSGTMPDPFPGRGKE